MVRFQLLMRSRSVWSTSSPSENTLTRTADAHNAPQSAVVIMEFGEGGGMSLEACS